MTATVCSKCADRLRSEVIAVHPSLNTLTPADTSVLTVEYKLNLLAPADGERLVARGEVIKPGRTLIVTRAEVFAIREEKWSLCAVMQQTIMAMHGRKEREA